MKQLFLPAFLCFFFLGKIAAQGLVFQDTTFTAPLSLSNEPEFVTFQNCRFVNFAGIALTLTNTGALLEGCTFENINGRAISLDNSEVYLIADTLRNINGDGVYAKFSTVVVQGSIFSDIPGAVLDCLGCDVVEMSGCDLADIGFGVSSVSAPDGQLSILNTHIRRVSSSPQVFLGTAVSASEIRFVEVQGCIIDSCTRSGIVLDRIGIIDPSAESVIIQGNTISRTNYSGVRGDQSSNAIIRGNQISYSGFLGESGICIRWSGPDARIEDNHLHHSIDSISSFGFGILIQNSATIARNHIHDCEADGIGYYSAAAVGVAPVLIFNNIIHDVGRHPIYFGATSNEPTQTIIRNNTLHATSSGDPSQDAPLAVCCNANPASAQGNILIYEGVADTSTYVYLSGGSLSESLNLKVPGDIGFVDYAGRNFHLASESSPAYNFLPPGFGLPNDDFDGTPRLGLHDAGADELQSTDTICGCVNCPMEIPDGFIGDFVFTVGSADNNELASPTQGVCGVRIDFTHEYLGDLTMELISPAGQIVQLMGPEGFWGSTENTAWNVGFTTCGEFATPDPGFSAVWNNDQGWGEFGGYTGVYYPAVGCLEDFNNGLVIGDWTLRVHDFQAVDAGIVFNFEVLFCDNAGLSCQPCSDLPNAAFTQNPFGAWGISLQNQTSGNASQLHLDFGDGQSSSGLALPTEHGYADTGTYLVRLIAINDCGADTFFQTVHIAGALPFATATVQPIVGCEPLGVQASISNADHVDGWHWIFVGGTPAESFEMEPMVTYTAAGVYPILLVISNEVGVDTVDGISDIAVLPLLGNPSFSLLAIGDSIVCTNTTQNAQSFYWTLNGGPPTGVNASPYVFELSNPGVYTVGFFVSNVCEAYTLADTVTVIFTGGKSLENQGWQLSLSPNPNDGRFNLYIAAPENSSATLSVLNALGQLVFLEKIGVSNGANLLPLDLEQLPAGAYNLQINTEQGKAVLRFVVR